MIHRFSRRFAALVAVGACVVMVAACGGSSTRDAATIDFNEGDAEHILRRDFNDELQQLLANDAFAAFLKEQGFDVKGETAAPSDVTAIWLSNLVRQGVIDRIFEEEELEVTDAARESAQTAVEANFGGAEIFKEFPKELRETLVGREARYQTVVAAISSEPPTSDMARALYEQQKPPECESGKDVRHILVDTEAKAQNVLTKLKAGEDFGALAASESSDSSGSSGGSVGCLVEGTFVKEFEDAAEKAELGVPVGPVKSQFGYHVILVEKYDASFQTLKPSIIQYLTQNPNLLPDLAVQAALDGVDIDPRYGKWVVDESGPHVQPPTKPDVRDEREPSTSTTAVPPGLPAG